MALARKLGVVIHAMWRDGTSFRFGVQAAHDLVPWHPTLGDVDSAQGLADYQAAKRVHKAEWTKGKAPA